MKLEIFCAMCGKEREIKIPLTLLSCSRSLHGIVETNGWIVQINGGAIDGHFDIYCSKKCAE